jgi:hypothetical protein
MHQAHWRKGIALMAMSKRLFRTNQAIESFEKCLQCESLPKNKEEEVQKELTKARNRLQQQKDDVSTMRILSPNLLFIQNIECCHVVHKQPSLDSSRALKIQTAIVESILTFDYL